MLLQLSSIAQSFPAGFTNVLVASGISNPTAMDFAPDGRIFVAQQDGILRVIKNGKLLPTPFVHLAVHSKGERGLVGIVVDPDFTTNQYIYLYYTLPDGSRNRISRFTATGDVAVAGSEAVVLNLSRITGATIHNGGAMHFKDGKLFVAVGENGYSNNAQDLDNYHGKLLRINPDGSVPEGNPFTSGSEARKRIWAYGFRNPFTFSIQPGTGRIYVNDVGQKTWEEINDATQSGKNFGWPMAEGVDSANRFANPVYTYMHGGFDGKGCAITGGVFFNPKTTNYPVTYSGRYFFQDYCNRWINTLTISGTTVTRQPFAKGLGGYALAINVGPDGNLYYLERSTGSLYKIVYSPSAAATIVQHPASVTVSAGQRATFSVSVTGTVPITYQWQKNGISISGATASSYTIDSTRRNDSGYYRVIVSNASGKDTSNRAKLTVSSFNAAPVAAITTPAAGTRYRGGSTITFSGTGTDAEDGTLPASAFTWLVYFHHGTHRHDGPPIATGVKSGSFTLPTTGEVAANVWYRLYLIIRDSKGRTDTVYRDIYPYKSTIRLASQPAGLRLLLDGQPVTTPFSVVGVQGIERTIGVIATQMYGGKNYEFVKWLHGGTASQTFSTPTNDTIFTAVFQEKTSSLLRAPENPSNITQGLEYAYYEGWWYWLPDFSTLVPVKKGSLSDVSVEPRMLADQYGFQFKGYIDIPEDGIYTFYTTSDDGSRLYIGSTLVVDNDSLHPIRERSRSIGLMRGRHAITISYFEFKGTEALAVSYASANMAKTRIPASAWYRDVNTALTATQATEAAAEEVSTAAYRVFPNPAGDYINLSFVARKNESVSIRLINAEGQTVRSSLVRKGFAGSQLIRYSIRNLTRGLYLLEIRTSRGVYTEKVLLQ
jgi:glucose/arabinose dehydrogenase